MPDSRTTLELWAALPMKQAKKALVAYQLCPQLLAALEHREHCECCIEQLHVCSELVRIQDTALADARAQLVKSTGGKHDG